MTKTLESRITAAEIKAIRMIQVVIKWDKRGNDHRRSDQDEFIQIV